jgi:hypothetical protein
VKIALKRGAVMQAPLCAIGFALGLNAWLHLRDIGNAVGSLAMLANIPWTVAVILPSNRTLQATEPEAAGEGSRALLLRWYSRHKMRSGPRLDRARLLFPRIAGALKRCRLG